MENNENKETKVPPKFNVPYQMNYGQMMEFAPTDGTQIQREVITDTYVTASENEDVMMEQISRDAEALKSKTSGFAGYFSFYYIMLTMFYIMKKYDMCFTVLDKIDKGVDAVEKYIMTGNYLDENGNDNGFVNFSFGETDEDLKNTLKYVIDAYNTAKLVHMKASSFESGYSLEVASIMLHGYSKQLGMMNKDADAIRKIVEHIRKFIENERDNPESGDVEASADMTFGSIEDLSSKKEN